MNYIMYLCIYLMKDERHSTFVFRIASLYKDMEVEDKLIEPNTHRSYAIL